MWIKRVEIENIRSIEQLEWKGADCPGWHVILGDNGSGKSSFLRSIALVLIGPDNAAAAGQDWKAWLRRESVSSNISLELTRDPGFDELSTKGRKDAGLAFSAGVKFESDGSITVPRAVKNTPDPYRRIWGTGKGWFSASYGPFRRFTGGDRDAERGFLANPKVGAHLSVFGEKVSLVESLYWLQSLKYKELEKKPEGYLLEYVKRFVNQDGFLPHGVKLRSVSSDGVEFEDPSGFVVDVQELGDGFRSILSMTFELIRQLNLQWGPERIFDSDGRRIQIPGVVLIDEVDAHLHPSWQKRAGFWFTEHFPRIQFIVTTHSPLICHAAENGSIFALPAPGSGDSGRMLEGVERDRLVLGDVTTAYATEAFGVYDTAPESAIEKRKRLASLNVKEIRNGLSAGEVREQQRLRAAFPTSYLKAR